MVVQFGYGAGDFIAGGTLIYQLIKTLSGTQCPSDEYREALSELGAFQIIFVQISQMSENPNVSPATINAASHIVLSAMTLIGDYATKTKGYRGRLSSWQNMGWVMFRADELRTLKDTLHVKMSSISLLLQTAQFCERIPRQAATIPIPQIELISSSSSSPARAQTRNQKLIEGSDGVGTMLSTVPRFTHNDRSLRLESPPPHLEDSQNETARQELVNQTMLVRSDRPYPGSTPSPSEPIHGTSSQKAHPFTRDSLLILPQRVDNGRVVDISLSPVRDDSFYIHLLTNYAVYTIRKIMPNDPKEKSTWAKAEIKKEPLSQQNILRGIKSLNSTPRSVQDKKAALMPFQHGQVTRLMDDLMSTDPSQLFEWSLAEIDQRITVNKKGQRETFLITVYVKRSPIKSCNPRAIYEAEKKINQQRLKDLN